MNLVEPNAPSLPSPVLVDSPVKKPRPAGRPLRKRAMHLIRRGHLYLGLFLFPWAVLYGVTAFLFNHPNAFSDRQQAASTTFGREAVSGTPLESWPTADEQAAEVVKLLNAKQSPATPYTLAGPAKLTRDNAFATIKAEGQNLNLLFDVKAVGGTITSRAAQPEQPKKEPERAPFAVGRQTAENPGRGGGRGGPGGGGEGRGGGRGGPGGEGRGGRGGEDTVKLENPLQDRLKTAIPVILERANMPTGEVTVTSVPEVTFPIEADGKVWTATYNPLTGSVSGKLPDADDNKPELGWRRFLLRLHTAHGYPGEQNARWFWAVIVDVMAFVMCFWGVSGLLMWWQLKGTRKVGFVILVLSAIAASGLGYAMHAAMAG